MVIDESKVHLKLYQTFRFVNGVFHGNSKGDAAFYHWEKAYVNEKYPIILT